MAGPSAVSPAAPEVNATVEPSRENTGEVLEPPVAFAPVELTETLGRLRS
ncbi:hypothetical protein GCM10010238_57000 [Streptomyces griseoviridis]|uniref:Uncharacterized protein n=1 Tax=Streptomyces griseoviridis TaxID=45398 RepID=A0A918GUY4_STRGD|nr:hypothetical protein GCM10010238_57000 [Streptomyces niveoruber]